MMKKFMCMLCFSLVLAAAPAWSETITMDGSDGMNVSSFNTGANWVGDAAPSAGNDYVTGNFTLRTPASGSSFTFAGDSLTVNNTNAYPAGLFYKGTGSTGQITINNLILDGGLISHGSGTSDVFNLYGNINVVSDSIIRAKQGPINVYSAISGNGKITNQAGDGGWPRVLRFYSPDNTWTGDLVNDGVFSMGNAFGRLNFVIGDDGVNNSLSGTGTAYLTGVFAFDLTAADTVLGSSWTIASITGQNFESTFSVLDFTDMGDNTWQKYTNGVTYEFSEATGVLAVIPEPATLALLGLGGLVLARRKR